MHVLNSRELDVSTGAAQDVNGLSHPVRFLAAVAEQRSVFGPILVA